jgi:hypothetical protein
LQQKSRLFEFSLHRDNCHIPSNKNATQNMRNQSENLVAMAGLARREMSYARAAGISAAAIA